MKREKRQQCKGVRGKMQFESHLHGYRRYCEQPGKQVIIGAVEVEDGPAPKGWRQRYYFAVPKSSYHALRRSNRLAQNVEKSLDRRQAFGIVVANEERDT